MSKRQFSLSKVVRNTLAVIVAVLIFLSATLIYSVQQNQNLATRYVDETAELYVNQLNRNLTAMLQELVLVLDPKDLVFQLPDYFSSSTSAAFDTLKHISEKLRVSEIRYNFTDSFFVYCEKGGTLITSHGTVFPSSVKTGYQQELMDYLKSSRDEKKVSVRHSLIAMKGNYYLLLWSTRKDKLAGAVINLETIFSELQDAAEGYQIYPYVKVMDRFWIFSNEAKAAGFDRTIEEKNDAECIHRYTIKGLGELSIFVPKDTGIMQQVTTWQLILIIVMIVSLVVCVIAAIIYYRMVMQPLKTFVKNLEQLSAEQELYATDDNHLLELANADKQFRSLLRKIQLLKIDIYERELREKQIELEFAQEQIKPHFFLNCVSLIHGIADAHQEKGIMEITSILSEYVRYLYRDSRALRPLEAETLHVQHYTAIQQYRYGQERFHFDLMMDDDLGSVEVPALLLQTLVENAFVHGMQPDRTGEFSLYITRENYEGAEVLYICVSDNGKGFSEETLQAIQNEEEIFYNGRKHVGLQNIRKRLQLIYGEKASFAISNMEEGFGAIVEVRIPM